MRLLAAAAVCLLMAAVLAGAETDREPLFEPRVVDARVDGVSLDRIDVSMQIAVRASRSVTLRTLAFSDGAIDTIPVWIAPIEGPWPLRRGVELVLPKRIAVTAYARDALAAASLADLAGRTHVAARAVVEMAFDAPWIARMFGTSTSVAVAEVAFEAPVPETMLPQPLVRLGAGVVEFMQRLAAPRLAAGPGGAAGARAVLDRFSQSVSMVETQYELQGGARHTRKTTRTLGVWWTPSVYCTTREALEPWRYSAADASLLQIGGAQRPDTSTKIRIHTAAGTPIVIDAAVLRRQLPKAADRSVYSLATGDPRRIRLAVRADPSSLVCLRLSDEEGPALPVALATGPVAAFAGEPSRGLVWTEAVASGSMLTLETPVHRPSFGSPLVTGDSVVGLVASSDAAWDARALALAAARAVRVTQR